MRFVDFLKEETEKQSSASIINDMLKNVGMGLELIRQTQTKENNQTYTYKENGHSVDALWMSEEGPMEEEGYSLEDGIAKLKKITDAFVSLGGKLIKTGSLRPKDYTKIKFDDFTVSLETIQINSALDGNGFNRKYLKIVTE